MVALLHGVGLEQQHVGGHALEHHGGRGPVVDRVRDRHQVAGGHHPSLGVGAKLTAGIGDPLAGLEPLDPGTHRLDHAGAFGAQGQGQIGQRIEPGALVDVDEVETDRGVPDADLAIAGIAHLDVLPCENLGPAGFMDTDCFGHVSVSWCWSAGLNESMKRDAFEMQQRALGLEAARVPSSRSWRRPRRPPGGTE